MSAPEVTEDELRENLKRCPQQAIDAAIAFSRTKDPKLVPVIVLGIIERFIEPELRPKLREGNDSLNIFEELGIDSLLMVEIVIMVEETLQISIENEELRNIRTLGDLNAYLDAKIKGLPIDARQDVYSLEQIAAIMPHGSPFLFLQEARFQDGVAEGYYRISGDEPFLEGHFKDNPVFPGSLMVESLGQLAVFFMLKAEHEAFEGVDPSKIFFVSCDGVRCHKICKPGELLHLKVSIKRVHTPLAIFQGSIVDRDGERIAQVESLTLTFAKFPETPASEAEAESR